MPAMPSRSLWIVSVVRKEKIATSGGPAIDSALRRAMRRGYHTPFWAVNAGRLLCRPPAGGRFTTQVGDNDLPTAEDAADRRGTAEEALRYLRGLCVLCGEKAVITDLSSEPTESGLLRSAAQTNGAG